MHAYTGTIGLQAGEQVSFLENTRFDSSIEKAAEDARAAGATPEEIRAASNGLA